MNRLHLHAKNSLVLFSLAGLSLHCSGKTEVAKKNPTEENPMTDGTGGADGSGGQEATGGDTGFTDLNLGGADGRGGPIDEVDLLFVIDNSVSMADKQELLRAAVPEMIRHLVDPPCVDDGGATSDPNADGSCSSGAYRQFVPIEDIHIGVISSSLGGHGSQLCPRGDPSWNNDDQGHLIASVRPGVPDPDGLGFLSWTGGDSAVAESLIQDFTAHVSATGESGCGFEAPLEAWYRFLVDPQPPQEIVVDPSTSRATMTTDAEGNPLVDETVLAQREAFLRPRSLVNIVVLTDENDCSMMDGGSYYNNAGFGYLVAEAGFDMPIATSACETNPNDKCCFSCLQKHSPPGGCSAADCDSQEKLSSSEDRANVRCFENKRRFGVDLLYPTDRYVSGLSDRTIIDARTGSEVDNPLLTGAGESNAGLGRADGRIIFTGIIGVPWQDIATQESLDSPDILEYLSADELREKFTYQGQEIDRWDVILGNRGVAQSDNRCGSAVEPHPDCGVAPVPPLDPFMIESIAERTPGLENPLSGDQIVASSSTNPTANAINGHEANHQIIDPVKYPDGGAANDDLQYACIFPLVTPKENCTEGDLSCDCSDEPLRNRPLCQPPGGGPTGNTQYYGKAYPGIRILEVLRDFGSNAVVSSICPKGANGYTPAITTTTTRVGEKLPAVR